MTLNDQKKKKKKKKTCFCTILSGFGFWAIWKFSKGVTNFNFLKISTDFDQHKQKQIRPSNHKKSKIQIPGENTEQKEKC